MIGRAVNRHYLLFTGAERLVRSASPSGAKAGAAARHG
jgi:hypothetical protein